MINCDRPWLPPAAQRRQRPGYGGGPTHDLDYAPWLIPAA